MHEGHTPEFSGVCPFCVRIRVYGLDYTSATVYNGGGVVSRAIALGVARISGVICRLGADPVHLRVNG
jgi:hypothetical protein